MAATAALSATALQETLQRLTEVGRGEHPVVTCYLKLEPRDRSRNKYQIKVKNRAKGVLEGLGSLGFRDGDHEAVERDLDRIQTFLRDPGNLPSAQGLAIFASERQGLFETVPLPLVYRSRLIVDRAPLIRELASIEDEFGRILAAVVDGKGARLFEVTAHGIEELPGVHSEHTRGKFHGDPGAGYGGWGEHNFNNRIREERHRHYDQVARELFAVDRRRPAHAIVLAGVGKEAAAIEPFLHPYLAERLIGVAKLNPRAVTPAMVQETVLEQRQIWERAQERLLVQELHEKAGTGWAVNGAAGTLKALSRGQVRVLLVQADAMLPGFRCSDTGRLTLAARDCRLEGDPVPVLDVVDDAIEEALRQSVEVNVVYDEEANESIDGMAALFRFK